MKTWPAAKPCHRATLAEIWAVLEFEGVDFYCFSFNEEGGFCVFHGHPDRPGSGRVGVLHSRADATQLNAEGIFLIGI